MSYEQKFFNLMTAEISLKPSGSVGEAVEKLMLGAIGTNVDIKSDIHGFIKEVVMYMNGVQLKSHLQALICNVDDMQDCTSKFKKEVTQELRALYRESKQVDMTELILLAIEDWQDSVLTVLIDE